MAAAAAPADDDGPRLDSYIDKARAFLFVLIGRERGHSLGSISALLKRNAHLQPSVVNSALQAKRRRNHLIALTLQQCMWRQP